MCYFFLTKELNKMNNNCNKIKFDSVNIKSDIEKKK